MRGQIFRPFAVIAINQPDKYSIEIAKAFKIGYVIIHPDDDAIMETFDPLFPVQDYAVSKTEQIKEKLRKMYQLNI